MSASQEQLASHIARIRSAAFELELEADLFQQQLAPRSPDDTLPPTADPTNPPPADEMDRVIGAGRARLALATALATVSQALSALQNAILAYDATAQGIARTLDATATR